MSHPPERKRVLITVRTYPTPARKGVEVSCTAGVTDQGAWIRLFPVPYRLMDPDKRFKKYQWIELSARRATGDPRPESYTPDIDSIRIKQGISTKDNWAERKQSVLPLVSHCLCCLERQRNETGVPTLGLFKPNEIKRLVVEPDEPRWTSAQLARLRQYPLFAATPSRELEKIPFKFKYEFHCDHWDCAGHSLSCTDWEICQSYRSWSRKYRDDWEGKLREKYEHEMIGLNETHFYVGTLRGHPAAWIIVGLFYPRADN